MRVKILEEHGYDNALRGMSYSFKNRESSVDLWWHNQRDRAISRAPLLANKTGGHDKFLRQIMLWIDVEASRAFWSEFDTYKIGTVAQSESTMHTLQKRAPNANDFEVGTHPLVIKTFTEIWYESKNDINQLKMNLPEGFLQRRLVTLNYAVVKNILNQRTDHRLVWWSVFLESIIMQLQHPELILCLNQQK